MDRRILTILIIVVLVIILAYALDHVLFPDLPIPKGTAPIMK